VKPKENGRYNELDQIKNKNVSRAGNEWEYRFLFPSILICVFFFKTVPIALERTSVLCSIMEENKAQVLCYLFSLSVNLTEFKLHSDKSLQWFLTKRLSEQRAKPTATLTRILDSF
jgi:hypothetical protein